MNCFGFFLSKNLLICPLILNGSFDGKSNLGCRSLLFITLNIFLPLPSVLQSFCWEISWWSYGSSLVGNCFSFAAFKILSFWILIMLCLGVYLFGIIWGSLCFLDLYIYFLHQIREVFWHFSNRFSISCSLSSPSNYPMTTLMLVHLKLSQRLLTLSIFFSSFCFLLSWLGCLFVCLFCFLIFQIADLFLGFIYSIVDSL